VNDLVLSVSDFVGLLNQTLEIAYPTIIVTGELANFRVSKNRWVYFDLKDEYASVRCFGTVYVLPGPLEDGMLLQVRCQPRLHPNYGFSLNIQSIQLAGEGSLKRAALLLQAKLAAEGLFDAQRKRPLPYPPTRIGLITSRESAAYADFIKILNQRWGGIEVLLADVQVQGEAAPGQIIEAIEHFNQRAQAPELLIIIRGGGSAEDLAAFSTEQVTRAVAGSRLPTLVAIGHEVDVSLAELAADQHASTPSNAAELLVPDKKHDIKRLESYEQSFKQALSSLITSHANNVQQQTTLLKQTIEHYMQRQRQELNGIKTFLQALNPTEVLKRGYTIVRFGQGGKAVTSARSIKLHSTLSIQWHDGEANVEVTKLNN
jgi:exodeoxyribonuclease VII large subunit